MLRLQTVRRTCSTHVSRSDPYGSSFKNHTEGMDCYCSLLSGGRPVLWGPPASHPFRAAHAITYAAPTKSSR